MSRRPAFSGRLCRTYRTALLALGDRDTDLCAHCGFLVSAHADLVREGPQPGRAEAKADAPVNLRGVCGRTADSFPGANDWDVCQTCDKAVAVHSGGSLADVLMAGFDREPRAQPSQRRRVESAVVALVPPPQNDAGFPRGQVAPRPMPEERPVFVSGPAERDTQFGGDVMRLPRWVCRKSAKEYVLGASITVPWSINSTDVTVAAVASFMPFNNIVPGSVLPFRLANGTRVGVKFDLEDRLWGWDVLASAYVTCAIVPDWKNEAFSVPGIFNVGYRTINLRQFDGKQPELTQVTLVLKNEGPVDARGHYTDAHMRVLMRPGREESIQGPVWPEMPQTVRVAYHVSGRWVAPAELDRTEFRPPAQGFMQIADAPGALYENHRLDDTRVYRTYTNPRAILPWGYVSYKLPLENSIGGYSNAKLALTKEAEAKLVRVTWHQVRMGMYGLTEEESRKLRPDYARMDPASANAARAQQKLDEREYLLKASAPPTEYPSCLICASDLSPSLKIVVFECSVPTNVHFMCTDCTTTVLCAPTGRAACPQCNTYVSVRRDVKCPALSYTLSLLTPETVRATSRAAAAAPPARLSPAVASPPVRAAPVALSAPRPPAVSSPPVRAAPAVPTPRPLAPAPAPPVPPVLSADAMRQARLRLLESRARGGQAARAAESNTAPMETKSTPPPATEAKLPAHQRPQPLGTDADLMLVDNAETVIIPPGPGTRTCGMCAKVWKASPSITECPLCQLPYVTTTKSCPRCRADVSIDAMQCSSCPFVFPQPGDWDCTVCTFVNPKQSNLCAMCCVLRQQ